MKNLIVLGALMCAILAVPASAKERKWQTGKVTEISSERFGVGNAGKLAAVLGQQHATHDKGSTPSRREKSAMWRSR